MMLAALLMATITAADAAPKRVTVAAPGLQSIRMEKDETEYFSEQLAQRLRLRGLTVSGAADVAALLGLERQRQLLGCGEESSSCAVELANALGADVLLVGSLGKFDGSYRLDVRALASKDGKVLTAYSSDADGDKALLGKLDEAAESLARGLSQAFGIQTLEVKPAHPLRSYAWAPAAVGGVAAAVGAWQLLEARSRYIGLTNGSAPPEEATSFRDDGKAMQVRGLVAMSAAVLALSAAGFMFTYTAQPSAMTSVEVAIGPAGIGVAGVFE